MKRILILLESIFMILFAWFMPGCDDEDSQSYQDKTLWEITADNYESGTVFIGGTTGSWAFDMEQGTILDREFSYVTPENDFKHSQIRVSNDSWSWDQADLWQQHIIDNNQILRIHCPIGPQCADWVKADSLTGSELETELVLFLKAIYQRYNGQQGFVYMDVVNETVHNGAWHEDKPGTDIWECPWFKIGQDTDSNQTPLFIKLAFELANEYAPGIKFIFNHNESPAETASWDLIKETIFYLRDNNLRVDGIGWQAHVDVGAELDSDAMQALTDLITWAHENDLEFHITEASVWLKEGNSYEQLYQQADTYKAILGTLIDMRGGGVVGWNIWHISDAYGWHTEYYPSLFDEYYQPKPAYYAVQELLGRRHD